MRAGSPFVLLSALPLAERFSRRSLVYRAREAPSAPPVPTLRPCSPAASSAAPWAFQSWEAEFGPVVGGMVVQLAFEERPYSLVLLLLHPGIGGVMHLAGRRRRRLLAMPPPPLVWPLAIWVTAAVLYNVVFFWLWPVPVH